MAFDSPIANPQGGVKASEIAMDRQLEIIKTQNNETALKAIELMMKPLGDAIRMNNFILHSTGQIRWSGTQIEFDSDSQGNHIILRLLLTDETAPRTIDIYLTGTTVANSSALFKTINLDDQELLYLEIDRAQLLAAVSPGGGNPARLTIGNNVSSSSTAVGARLQKVSLTAGGGMPAMLSTESGLTTSQTINIPLASCFQWSDGTPGPSGTFKDLWWIPHGIRWPAGTRSVLGAVVVKGLETLPSTFVRTEAELTAALTDYGTTGGIILISQSFTLNTQISVPPGVILTTRSNLSNYNAAIPVITMESGSRITLQADSKLWNMVIKGGLNFGKTVTEYMVLMTVNNARIDACSFGLTRTDLTTPAALSICVEVTGTNHRIWDSKFRLGLTDVPQRVGIRYSSGSNNNDIDSIFELS